MPVGPQHRSGGGGRSFGGSRRSGFGGSSVNRRTSFGPRNVFIFGGMIQNQNQSSEPVKPIDPELASSLKRKSKATLIMTLMIVLFVISTIILLSVNASKNNYATKLDIMDSDAVFYEALLNDPSATRVTANVKWETYYMTYEGVDYYYVEYYYFNYPLNIDTETYAQFTSADIGALGSTIGIVYDKDGYSINESWVKENAEYLYTKSQLSTYTTTTTIFIILEIVFALLLAFAIRNNIKVSKVENEKIKKKMQETVKEQKEQADVEKHGVKCEYCGSRIPDGKNKCPNCGATK